MTVMHLCDNIYMKLLQKTDHQVEAIQFDNACYVSKTHHNTNLQQDTQSQMTLLRKDITLYHYTTVY